MTYVGAVPTTGDFKLLDSITTSSATTFNLRQGGVAVYPQSANHCIVQLNGVNQVPTSSFNIVNDTIVFASSLSSDDVINQILVLGNVNDIGVPSDDTVSTAKLQSSAVTDAKISAMASSKLTGVVPTANLGSGTASSSTVLFGDQTFKTAPSGGLAFITAVNTTAASSITFSNCFSSTYKNYAIFFTNINFSSDSDLGFQFGNDSGYGTDYKGASHGYESGQVGTAYNSGQSYAKPAGALFGVDTAANSQQGMTGSGIIYMPQDSSSAVYGTFQVGCRNEANSQWVIANTWFTNNSDVSYTHLKALSTSGDNFNTHGRIAIYGIKDS